ncbi:MAG: type II toxin-antitoxin system Phd/YefM family antitoxin [Richelia sp. RM2_1_2]|nr:type II toxin-antitoxin system Phd/YefM family antitoxin [Richelia sp. SM2_1_7]NJN07690.1 type II toxin-antitoxin system Phd/YefM family antitoxin [Richelia sp. RM1_1_1]NJO31280.1 type II toxin-antitoxin system Phd/YefM family antitoxin [Richelia sp. SL_2_1]NJO61297.1 type II toxin-antitoxin system Phd/YefM family antitoxin [Richelia sp. RM2_1_2]
MEQQWQLQEAKNKLSEVIDKAIHEGAQVITRRGIEVAIVLSYAEYRQMVASKKKISEFFRESPLAEDFTKTANTSSC